MGVDGVCFEVMWEGAKAQLVENAALLDGEIILNFAIAPIGQVLWIVVDRIESVATNEGDCVGKDRSRDGERRCDSRSRNHWNFGTLCAILW